MNKIILSGLLIFGGITWGYAGSVAEYLEGVEQANQQYQQNTRQFFRHLDPQQQKFSMEQQVQYCDMVQTYINQLYAVVLENQGVFKSQKKYSKQEVILDVTSRREMQILKKYGVVCHLE